MRTLVTFPGRCGDIFWMLPTARALAEAQDAPVDLLIAGEFQSMLPLLQQQPYLGEVLSTDAWSLSEGWQPPEMDRLAQEWDRVFHLGYKRWPELPLPYETAQNVSADYPIDLQRPWITVDGYAATNLHLCDVAVGFTEAWFELKLGLLSSIDLQLGWSKLTQLTPPGSRWTTEASGLSVIASSWTHHAALIKDSRLFFGDCSALHVLAVAMGKPVLVCEPMEARWQPIFWPLGMTGPQVTCVMGIDGRPTFDARACALALKEALRG